MMFGSQETIHAVAYSYLNETLGLEDFAAFLHEPTMADKFDLCCCLNKHICSFGPPDQAFTPEVLEELYGSHSQLMLGVRPE